jgi:hypothetical protein
VLWAALALAGCRKDPPPPPPDPAPSASASGARAPRGVSDFPEDPDAPPPTRNLGPAPATATREAREKRVLDLLAGKLPAADVADEPTDPEAEFDPRLRTMLTHQRKRGEIRLGTVMATGIGVDVVTRAARDRLPAVHACYRRGLRFNPNLQGRVVIALAIGAEGNVTEAKNGGSDVPDGAVVTCAQKAFGGIVIGKPTGEGAKAAVPIILTPED